MVWAGGQAGCVPELSPRLDNRLLALRDAAAASAVGFPQCTHLPREQLRIRPRTGDGHLHVVMHVAAQPSLAYMSHVSHVSQPCTTARVCAPTQPARLRDSSLQPQKLVTQLPNTLTSLWAVWPPHAVEQHTTRFSPVITGTEPVRQKRALLPTK